MNTTPLRIMALFSVALWGVLGFNLLLRPYATIGAALFRYYPYWVTLQWDVVQASPVPVAITVLFGCVLLALTGFTVTLLLQRDERVLRTLLLWAHGSFVFAAAAMLVRGGFQEMLPVILAVCFPSVCIVVLIGLIAMMRRHS